VAAPLTCLLSRFHSYNRFPGRLQLAVRQMFEQATRRIRIEGVEIVPVPLFEILDGSDTRDYVERVEPSPQGGKKMANAFLDIICADSAVTNQPRSAAG